jgi:hypothetical protein
MAMSPFPTAYITKLIFAQTFNMIAALILLDKHFATRTLLEVKFSLQK